MERSLPSSMPVLDKPGEEATRRVYLQFEYPREWVGEHVSEEPLFFHRPNLIKSSVLRRNDRLPTLDSC